MSKRSIWGLCIIILLVLLTACEPEDSPTVDTSNFTMPNHPTNLSSVKVSNVIDGDTVDLSSGERIRLLGINTPEREEEGYSDASNFMRNRLEGKTVEIEYDVERTDQFGRTLAYLWDGDSLVNVEAVLGGFATAYNIEPNSKYASTFRRAESQAQANGAGIWKKGVDGLVIVTINYDAPGPDEDNPNGEWIEIQNTTSQSIALRDYSLQDNSSAHLYNFGNFNLGAGKSVKIYSGCGSDSSSELYWCARTAVWNNGGDAAALRDTRGDLVASYRYGN